MGNPEPRYKCNVNADSIDGVTWDQESECLHLNFFGQFFFTAHFQNLPYRDWVKMVTPIFQYNFTKIPLPNSTNGMDIEICQKQQNFTTDAENQLNL